MTRIINLTDGNAARAVVFHKMMMEMIDTALNNPVNSAQKKELTNLKEDLEKFNTDFEDAVHISEFKIEERVITAMLSILNTINETFNKTIAQHESVSTEFQISITNKIQNIVRILAMMTDGSRIDELNDALVEIEADITGIDKDAYRVGHA
jgi:DNA anti-recombination protein RmuC